MAEETAVEILNLPVLKDRSEQALALIRGLHITEPKLHDAIEILAKQIGMVTRTLSPVVKAVGARVAAAVTLIPPTAIGYLLTGTSVRLSWTRPPISGLLSYEVRFGTTDWDTSEFVIRTQSTTIDVDPFTGLTGTYRVKTLNDIGEYSVDEITIGVVVVAPGPISITAQVIDNNILMYWADPVVGSFDIDFYSIYRDGVFQGTTKGTFTSFFEVVSGVYEYSLIPVDIAENVGASSSVELVVNQPPDYVLQDEFNSTFTGTKVNVLDYPGPSLLANVASQSWEDHFTTRFWLDPEDQVTAGFPIYIQPAELTGSYEEVIDYGVTLSNVIAVVRYNTEMFTAGTCAVVVKLATSLDDITYTAFSIGSSQFIPTLRYLKVRIEFTSSATTVLMRFFNLIVYLSVKRENDGGEESALAADVLGTEVTFNKDFKDVESITATVLSPTEPYVVVVDFVDIPDPTSFRVFVFDTTGNRVDKTIEWKARGVV